MRKAFYAAVVFCAVTLIGCASAGSEYQSNVWDASQVNTQQEAKVVKILTVSPAKVKVSNEHNKEVAQTVGALLGAVAGVGTQASHSTNAKVGGAAAGGVVGYATGSLVDDTTLVDGVLLSYQGDDGKIYTSAQVGRMCDFAAGQNSLLVSMKSGETRIQPNAQCPSQDK